MNFSPEWVGLLTRPGWTVRRWNQVGKPNADDPDIAAWAAQNRFTVLTQDLDFSDILFMTQADAPGVILLRSNDELSPEFRAHVLRCIIAAENNCTHLPCWSLTGIMRAGVRCPSEVIPMNRIKPPTLGQLRELVRRLPGGKLLDFCDGSMPTMPGNWRKERKTVPTCSNGV